MKVIEVVAAIIFDKDTIFTTQREYGEFNDWWEFPGGKIEKNEAKQDALKREIKEELDIDIAIEDFITNDDGSIRSYDAIRRIFDRFAKKHDCRQEFGLHCHMLKQKFSNMQIENKRDIKDVKHLLEHKDAKTTQLHYNSVIDQELDYEGAELLYSLFNDTILYDGEEHIKKMFLPTT